jgi:hypothetical protein
MRIGQIRFLSILLFLSWTLTFAQSASQGASNDLGISTKVVSDASPNHPNTAGTSTEITTLINPGASFARYIRIQNYGILKSEYSPTIESSHYQAGDQTRGDHTVSDLSKYATFSPANLVLAPGQVGYLKLTLAIPISAQIGVHFATLFINVNPVNKVQNVKHKGTVAVFSSNLRAAIQMAIGIGTPVSIPVNFLITGVHEIFSKQLPYLEIKVKNLSTLPINPVGAAHFNDPNGVLSISTPLEFAFQMIAPLSEGIVDVYIPKTIPANTWMVHVDALQGATSESKESAIKIAQVNKFNFAILERVGALLMFLLLIVFGTLLIRKPKENSNPTKKEVKKLGDGTQDEIDEILNRIFTELDPKQIAKKSGKKKVATKSAKKLSAKKASTKKK